VSGSAAKPRPAAGAAPRRRAKARGFVPFHVSLDKPPKLPRPVAADLTQADRLFNRHLSWLAFNDRVLGEAADSAVPALERLRFAAIVSSNLDEFFSVRVAEVAAIARRRPSYRFPDGLTATRALSQIRDHVLFQKSRQAVVFREIVTALFAKDIDLHVEFEVNRELDREIQARLPEMSLCLRRKGDPLPWLASERIHAFVRFAGEYAVITIEEREARLMELARVENLRRFVLLERWLCARAAEIFPDREVIEAFPFKIIRAADLRYRPDEEETLEEQIQTAALRRRRGKAVRLEVDAPTYSEGVFSLATALGINSAGLYRFDLPLDLRTLARVYDVDGGEALRYPPVQPVVARPFRKTRGLFETIRRRDILLHHPYDAYDTVVKFVEAAAEDAAVTRISHTVYRTTRESPVMAALQKAARAGKRVTVYVEIRARFDELNNVRWAEALRRSGVRVVRPMGHHKVHSKLTQVVRTEDGREASYLHLGTGNYHAITARQYTDLSLLTCDAELGRDVDAYFSAIERRHNPPGSEDLIVAPNHLHAEILRLIRNETRLQREGGKGHIIAKMNSLADPLLIDALYEASSAGVTVELLVRGICCLIPGLKGLSENIRVVSVIDRFLEHSRIYYFRDGGKERVFLSSADWMPRNFFTRYEVAFAIKDAHLKRYIRDVILATGLADNQKAWTLRSDGSYTREALPGDAKPIRSQFWLEALAQRDYRDTPLADR
jgi:polyphosphate kinase